MFRLEQTRFSYRTSCQFGNYPQPYTRRPLQHFTLLGWGLAVVRPQTVVNIGRRDSGMPGSDRDLVQYPDNQDGFCCRYHSGG